MHFVNDEIPSSKEFYLYLVTTFVITNLTLGFSLGLEVDPELASWARGVLGVVVYAPIVLLIDDWVRPCGAFRM